jgi:hypothetical protein
LIFSGLKPAAGTPLTDVVGGHTGPPQREIPASLQGRRDCPVESAVITVIAVIDLIIFTSAVTGIIGAAREMARSI